MHILTGLLLAKLLKAKASAAAPVDSGAGGATVSMPGVIETLHVLPGRIRFRLPVLRGRPEACAQTEDRLRNVDGISGVAVSPVSGSVLVHYRPGRLKPDLLAAALVRMLGLDRAFSGRVEASLAREIKAWGRALNLAVYQKTGGVLDLRTALLVLLAVAGTKKILSQRALAMPAGFTLLWWAGSGLMREDGEAV